MTNPINLSDNQRDVLEHAIDHTQGTVVWFPEHIKGGARHKVLEGLFKRALVSQQNEGWAVTAAAYEALGRTPPVFEDDDNAADSPTESEDAAAPQHDEPLLATVVPDPCEPANSAAPQARANSKQGIVIDVLKRPEGATIAQMQAATGWQAHSVRGILAGTLKKRFKLDIVSEKRPNLERVYRSAQPTLR